MPDEIAASLAQFAHGCVIAFLHLPDAEADVFQVAAEGDEFVVKLPALLGDLAGEAVLVVLLPELSDEARGGVTSTTLRSSAASTRSGAVSSAACKAGSTGTKRKTKSGDFSPGSEA